MSDVIKKPTVTALGYKCVAASMVATINQPLTLRLTIASGDSDGSIITTDDIMNLAKTAQDKINKSAKKPDFNVSIDGGFAGSACNYNMVLTNCEVVASTGGGLACQISASSEDMLVENFDSSIYAFNCEPTASEVVFPQESHFWTKRCRKVAEGISSVSELVLDLLTTAKEKYTLDQTAKLSDADKAYVTAAKTLNNNSFKLVKRFLEQSKDTTKLLNDKFTPDLNNRVTIADWICRRLFSNGDGLFSKLLFMLPNDFLCWYIPDFKTGGIGKFRNQNYSNEVTKSITVPVTSFSANLGRGISNMLVPSQIVVEASLQPVSSNVAIAYKGKATAYFPQDNNTDKESGGSTYCLAAPAWLNLPPRLISPNKSKESKRSRNIANSKKDQDETAKGKQESEKLEEPALSYLAEMYFYKLKYQNCTASVICPFTTEINAEIGDFVEVKATQGGHLLSGILTGVSHTLMPSGLSTTLLFARVEI